MAESSGDRLQFKIHPRVFEALGADLVTNDIVAVIELVKNSYDAFAHLVTIALVEDGRRGRYLEVADDGVGMSRRTLEEAWCMVGTPNRKNNPIVERDGRKRRASGNKGLGRLSAARLGRRLEVVTKANRDACWQLSVDWPSLAAEASLSDCYVGCTRLDGPSPFSTTGTRLRIFDLQEPWDEEQIEDLRDNLGRLVSPFANVTDFEIRFSTWLDRGKAVSTRIEAPDFLSHPPYAIRGHFTTEGEIIAKYEFRPLGRPGKPRHHPISMEWNKLRDETDIPGRLKKATTTCGPFEFEIRAWDIGADDTQEIAEHFKIAKQKIRQAIRAHKGLSVYRDGILVLPKSDSARDWLGLDLRRISRVGERLSTSQIVGYVAISGEGNPKLEDTSDREGLVKNEAVSIFQEVLKAIVVQLETGRDEDRLRREDGSKLADLLDGVSAESLVSEIERMAQESAEADEIVFRVRGFAAKLENVRDAIKKRFLHYSRLATVGTISQMLVHEIRNRTTSLGKFIRVARQSKCAEQSDFSRSMELASSSIVALESLADTFAPLASRSFRRGHRDALVEESIERCLSLLDGDIKKTGITVETSALPHIRTAVDPGELDTILLNILLNAIYWTPKSKGSAKIDIAARRLIDGKKMRIAVHDSGPGVSEEDAEKIFLPGVTRKPGGIGMGLTVAAELVSEYGGNIVLESPGKLGGASFSFDLPIKSE